MSQQTLMDMRLYQINTDKHSPNKKKNSNVCTDKLKNIYEDLYKISTI